MRDLIGRIRIDEAHDDINQAHLARLDGFIVTQQQVISAGVAAERDLDRFETFLDALRDANFAFTRQQFNRAHFAHVHAHGVRGATEFRVEIGECRSGFLHRFFIRGRSGVGQQQ